MTGTRSDPSLAGSESDDPEHGKICCLGGDFECSSGLGIANPANSIILASVPKKILPVCSFSVIGPDIAPHSHCC